MFSFDEILAEILAGLFVIVAGAILIVRGLLRLLAELAAVILILVLQLMIFVIANWKILTVVALITGHSPSFTLLRGH